jgi:2',3'-cyclic-nucleotide 2'-phosphodiesterase (5'-nucleotidase family)
MRSAASRLLAAGLLCTVATTGVTGLTPRVSGLSRVSAQHQSFAVLDHQGPANTANTVTLSIVGTTDLHGAVFPTNGRGGLAVLAGFVNNLRAARAADGGAVLLLDAGDTFLDGMESNLSEGALVVDAYNAMGYTAAAIGNHEFDYGSVDAPGARQTSGDLRGALKARAVQARYSFLAANLIDTSTDRVVEWPNVRPSTAVEAAGVRVGIVGLMTVDALAATAPVNVAGLRVAQRLHPRDKTGRFELLRAQLLPLDAFHKCHHDGTKNTKQDFERGLVFVHFVSSWLFLSMR